MNTGKYENLLFPDTNDEVFIELLSFTSLPKNKFCKINNIITKINPFVINRIVTLVDIKLKVKVPTKPVVRVI